MLALKPSIAKQWKTITINQFKAIYNNLKIVDPQDVAKLSGIKIANNQILIMATKRPENPTKPPAWFTSYMSRFEKSIDQKFENKMPAWFKKWNKEVFENVIKHITITIQDLMKEIKSINARLDKHEKMFKAHGWIK